MTPRTFTGLVGGAMFTMWSTGVLAAGPYTDDLSKCLVKVTTDADRTVIVQWLFAMIALHPSVKSMATVSDADRTALTQKAAGVMEHLLTVSCQSETRDAVKYEGNGAVETSFNVLGQVAARDLLSNPQVAAGVADLQKFIDAEKSQSRPFRDTAPLLPIPQCRHAHADHERELSLRLPQSRSHSLHICGPKRRYPRRP